MSGSVYSKPWLPIEGQLQKLESNGLVVCDRNAAQLFLRHLNYYRFSGYGLAFESSRHQYQAGTTFEQIRAAYEFDRSLRDLVYESMEVIELDIRTSVAYRFGEVYGPFGHTDSKKFYHRFNHDIWLNALRLEAKRSRERFVSHLKHAYGEYPDLPIRVATEVMSFGAISRMISGMHKSDTKFLSNRYGMQPRTFVSCLHHLVYVRNICAHHARLWDRKWAIVPNLPAGRNWSNPLLPSNDRLFASLLLQNVVLKRCAAERSFANDWNERVEALIRESLPCCRKPLEQMGLTKNWHEHPLWRTKE